MKKKRKKFQLIKLYFLLKVKIKLVISSIHPSNAVTICLSTYLPTYLPAYLPTCPPAHQPMIKSV
jgi:hypothetical protein